MNAFFTVIPFLLIRFGLLSILDKEALKRAAYFAPLIGKEKVALWFYQISNLLLFISLCFFNLTTDTYWFYAGLMVYGLGLLLCLVSVLNFAKPSENGINLKGLYQFSRNPMYVAYFIYF
ncbi:hypothetical protein [Anaerocolumna sp. MB42-C2]|uniref:hypothetical protein n=1 Tax=Anaerocolumna sp. MB42-C2 TaxID=3070997 RepID=UPI002ED3FD8C